MAMATLWRTLATAALLLGLWSLRRLLQRRNLPAPPWRLPGMALLLILLQKLPVDNIHLADMELKNLY